MVSFATVSSRSTTNVNIGGEIETVVLCAYAFGTTTNVEVQLMRAAAESSRRTNRRAQITARRVGGWVFINMEEKPLKKMIATAKRLPLLRPPCASSG